MFNACLSGCYPWALFLASDVAAALFLNVVAARECPSVYGLSQGRDAQGEADQNKRPPPSASVATEPTQELQPGPNDEGCYAGPFGISSGGWVALFTLALTLSTVGLWITTEIAARRADMASLRQVIETRRIGEAQVRAYVDIPTANIAFLHDFLPGEAMPQIQIIARNSGQSPARGFLWRPTLRYFVQARRRSREMPVWVSDRGVTIPANSTAPPDRFLMNDMIISRFVRNGETDVVINLRIEFQYRDVFDRAITEDAYFVGTAAARPDQNGRLRWGTSNLTPMPVMHGWNDPYPHGLDE